MTIFILTSILLNIIFIVFYKKISIFLNIFDVPDNGRKLHKEKIASIGGVIFFVNLIYFFIYLTLNDDLISGHRSKFLNGYKQYFSFFFVSALVFFIGILDDKANLSAFKKSIFFIIVIIFSLIDKNMIIQSIDLSFFTHKIYLDHFGMLFTVFAIFYFINALNMFDGINIQTPLYLFLIFLFLIYKDQAIAVFLIVPCLFFLILNIKGKCFLGNSGSYMIGYLVSLIFIKINKFNSNLLSTEEILIILSLPCFELFRLFTERLLKDKNPFTGDRNHIHHYLNKKFSILTTSLITNGFIFIPLIICQFFQTKIIIFFLQFFLYFLIINKLKKI